MVEEPDQEDTLAEEPEGEEEDLPDVGAVLRRLRLQRGLPLREVARASGLAPSFLLAVERGDSDISVRRLARLARFFGHDVGSLLGYTSRGPKPEWVGPENRKLIDRGPGVRYEVLELPGLGMELILVDLEPGAEFDRELSHSGIDVVLVTRGEIVLTFNHRDYTVRAGECVVYPGAYPHRERNDTKQPASEISITTERMY